MIDAKSLFNREMDRIETIFNLGEFLKDNCYSNIGHFSDLYRIVLVYSLSAFDKLLHDLIKIGIGDIFTKKRAVTKKYLNEPIPMSIMESVYDKDLISAKIALDTAIYGKLRVISYQDPQKVSDGLSFIWDENQKWKKLSDSLNMNEEEVKQTLKLITSRRNSIVHESDIDPISLTKREIEQDDVKNNIVFLRSLGNAICEHVIVL